MGVMIPFPPRPPPRGMRVPVTVPLEAHLQALYPHLTQAQDRRQLSLHGEEEANLPVELRDDR